MISAPEGALVQRPGWAARCGMALIRGYQRFISPLTPPACRFSPTCSQYTMTAVQHYGLVRGSWMGLKRIGRCHPLNPGGYDPVPLEFEDSRDSQ